MSMWNNIAALIGTVGGVVGIWSAVITLRRNRVRIQITVERKYLSKVFVRADKYNDDTDRNEPRDWAVIHLRNLGDKAARLDTLEIYFAQSPGPGTWGNIIPLEGLVLGEQRRRYTYAMDITHRGSSALAAVVTREDSGRTHRRLCGSTLSGRFRAWSAYRRHKRADKDIERQQHAAIADLDKHRSKQ